MNKFEKIYNKIIKDLNSISEDEREFINFESVLNNYEVITEDTINILNEYVSDSELTPVPKEFLNIICNKVKYRRDNITIISIKEIYELLRENEYPFYEEFRSNLKTFNGNLYIILLFDRDYKFIENDNIFFNKTYLFVNQYVQDQEISKILCKELLKDKHKTVDAFCSKTDNSLKNNTFFQNNGLIFISLKAEFIKDSLEHELTHFIQKTIGMEKVINKIKKSDLNNFENQNKESFQNLYNWVCDFANDDTLLINYLLQFFSVKFRTNEIHQSVKAVLNGFQRIYEYGKFNYIKGLDFSKNELNKAESNNDSDFRLRWLETFLETINDKKFIINDLKPVIKNLSIENDQQQYLIKYRSYFIILLYYGFNKMFSNYNINEKLKEHFSNFKFKDN